MDTQQIARNIEAISTFCDFQIDENGKVAIVERPGATHKQQWELDEFKATIAVDASARDAIKKCIADACAKPLEAPKREALPGNLDSPLFVKVEVTQATAPIVIGPENTYQGDPSPEAVDVADQILSFIAEQGDTVSESDILAVIGGENDDDRLFTRNVLYRLAIDGLVEMGKGSLYELPSYPPKPAIHPDWCPLKSEDIVPPVPKECKFEENLFRRLKDEGVLPLPGGRCPLRRLCGPNR